MTGESHTRTGPSDRVRVEPDGVTCSNCDQPGEVATPAGPMCQEHADRLASHYEADR